MNMKNNIIAVFVSAALIAGAGILPAFAQTGLNVGLNTSATATVNTGGNGAHVGVGLSANASATISARIEARIQDAKTRADEEITRRINSLNALLARVNGMVKLSADEKTSLSTQIQSQVGDMNTLQSQVAADASANSTTSLKTDIQSITKAYRIYLLIIPQGAIEAAADRAENIASLMSQFATKLQDRVTAAQSAGANVSSSVTVLADMNAKIADANAQAQAAVTEVASLQPDNGVQSVMQANVAAMQDAHKKIQAAQQDLVAARKDAGDIVKVLVSLKVSANASSTFE